MSALIAGHERAISGPVVQAEAAGVAALAAEWFTAGADGACAGGAARGIPPHDALLSDCDGWPCGWHGVSTSIGAAVRSRRSSSGVCGIAPPSPLLRISLMYLAEKFHNVRGFVQRYGPQALKRHLWNAEFSSGRWDCLDKKGQDSVHHEVEKYANQGAVLDLGCSWGNISIELNPSAYSFYTGVDMSDVAIEKARAKAISTGRADRNEYRNNDILTFLPERQYTVIVFGDSIYYVPLAQIIPLLKRYSQHLASAGVFIVRSFDARGKLRRIVDLIESHFEVVDKNLVEYTNACNSGVSTAPFRSLASSSSPIVIHLAGTDDVRKSPVTEVIGRLIGKG